MLAYWFIFVIYLFRFVIYLFIGLPLGLQRRIPHWLGKGRRLYSEIRKVWSMQHAHLVLVILLSVYRLAVLVSCANIVMFSREADK